MRPYAWLIPRLAALSWWACGVPGWRAARGRSVDNGEVGVVLFDVDGVLRDSYSQHVSAWRSWCMLRGLDEGLVGLRTFGRRTWDVVAEMAPGLDVDRECALLDRLLNEQGAISPMAGAPRLLSSLLADSWAIVTSGARDEVLAWFIEAGLPQPANAVFGGDVSRGKPDPSCYLLAAHRLGAAPAECLVVEDVPAGIAAGRAAGMTVLGIGSSCPAEELDGDHFAGSLLEAQEFIQAWTQATKRRQAG